jgi:hypothetical protein
MVRAVSVLIVVGVFMAMIQPFDSGVLLELSAPQEKLSQQAA